MGLRITAILCIIGGILPYTSGANYTAYWNVPTMHCRKNIAAVLDTYGFVHNTNDSFIGDKVALFYEYTFGVYPYFKDQNISLPVNKGTPQNITTEDLNRHINISLYNISKHLTCENSSGLGVVDFEEWRPLYDINSVKKVVYKLAAIELTKMKHPNMSSEDVNKTAVTEYDEAAKEFLLATLNNATNERNETHWGMYGFPYCNYDAGVIKETNRTPELRDYRCMSSYQELNNRMQYIFNASQALYPSIYLNNASTPERNFRYVQAIMAETLRVAQNYSPPLPIYVYSKFEYDPLKNLCSFYTEKDLCSTIVLPYVMGAQGIIFWSSSNNMTDRCDIIKNFVDTTLGPLVQNVTKISETNYTQPYNTTSFLEFDGVCKEYLPHIVNFTDTRCNKTTTPAMAAKLVPK